MGSVEGVMVVVVGGVGVDSGVVVVCCAVAGSAE